MIRGQPLPSISKSTAEGDHDDIDDVPVSSE
jgi:hypothetical protein